MKWSKELLTKECVIFRIEQSDKEQFIKHMLTMINMDPKEFETNFVVNDDDLFDNEGPLD